MVSARKNSYSLYRCGYPRPHDQWQSNEKSKRVARPERAEPSLPPHGFWSCRTAGATSTFAQNISVSGDESVDQPPQIAKREQRSKHSNEPGGRKQMGETSNCIPAHADFTRRSGEVQLLQAI